MKWKIVVVILTAFIVWTWLLPTLEGIYWHFYQSALSGMCDYSDGSIRATGTKTLGFDWRYGVVTFETKCPNH